MLDMERVRGGAPQSRGYGFCEFRYHRDALACLRELNNNKSYSHQASHLGLSKKDTEEKIQPKLIVEFSLENMQKVKVLREREERQAQKRVVPKSGEGELSCDLEVHAFFLGA